MQSGLWETIADTLFWMQLVWIFSGFCFMAYLAFRVFPHRGDDSEATLSRPKPHDRRERMITAKYRFEDFPCCSNSTSAFLLKENSRAAYSFTSSSDDRAQQTVSHWRRSAHR